MSVLFVVLYERYYSKASKNMVYMNFPLHASRNFLNFTFIVYITYFVSVSDVWQSTL